MVLPPKQAFKLFRRSLVFSFRRKLRKIKGKAVIERKALNPTHMEDGTPRGKIIGPGRSELWVATPVEKASLETITRAKKAKEAALFVTHSPDGRIKPHARILAEALTKSGIAVTLIIAADVPMRESLDWATEQFNGVYIRENIGFAFAAWFHILRHCPDLLDAEFLIFANDSVFGPTKLEMLQQMINRIRASDADLLGATESYEGGWHLQSYFLTLKSNLLRSLAFHSFARSVKNLATKDQVTTNCELKFAQFVRDSGFKADALFVSETSTNPTLFEWKRLLSKGFPFVKVMAIRDDVPGVDKTDWRQVVYDEGLDPKVISDYLKHWFRSHHDDLNSMPASFENMRVLFIGPWNYTNGLGVASRGYVRSLLQLDCELNIEPIRRPFGLHRQSAPNRAMTSFAGAADVAIVHLNPEAWSLLLTEEQKSAIASAKYVIGLFVWETEQLPEIFHDRLDSIDEVWAPSSYCAQAFEASSDTKVRVVHHQVEIDNAAPDLDKVEETLIRYDLPVDKKIILYSFDASSFVKRKNPLFLIKSFQKSGLSRSGWALVLKCKHLEFAGREGKEAYDLALSTPGVHILDKVLSDSEYEYLLKAASIYASPHSSEGFGLTIAEAMGRGQIVVATDYGGSKDFLDVECGFPVVAHRTKLDKAIGPYSEGSVWAEPDLEDFTQKLKMAANLQPDERNRISSQALNRIEKQLSAKAVANTIRQALEALLKAETATPSSTQKVRQDAH